MTVTIRRAGPGDGATIVRLTQEMAVGEDDISPIDEAYAHRFLASPTAGVLLAEDEGEAIGLLSYVFVPGLFHAADSGLVEMLIVTGARRGEGIGRRLVDTALGVFREGGCAEASVSTSQENEIAQKVYRGAGLTESSLLLETHFDPGSRLSMMQVDLRPLDVGDEPFLHEMLREADRWRLPIDAPRPPLAEILADPHVRLYVEGWGRPGDDGVVAEVAGRLAGACWLRLFDSESRGWGFVGPDVPELSIAVAPQWRRRGVGRRLLAAAVARAEQLGHPAISLSVMPDNPARELYLHAGFRRIAVVDGSWTMMLRLPQDSVD